MPASLSALDAFNDNLADANLLISLAEALTNQRNRRMRRELREKIGAALNVGRKERQHLDCVESNDFFVVIKPGSRLERENLADARPLLRQALVAGSAAFETYVADRVMELLGPALRSKEPPRKLLDIRLSLRDYFEIDGYERKGWGIRAVVRHTVEELASPAPGQVGRAFQIVGVEQVMRKVDKRRGLEVGTTTERLERIYERRNRIAHAADRRGTGRAQLSTDEARDDINELVAVVGALEAVTAAA